MQSFTVMKQSTLYGAFGIKTNSDCVPSSPKSKQPNGDVLVDKCESNGTSKSNPRKDTEVALENHQPGSNDKSLSQEKTNNNDYDKSHKRQLKRSLSLSNKRVKSSVKDNSALELNTSSKMEADAKEKGEVVAYEDFLKEIGSQPTQVQEAAIEEQAEATKTCGRRKLTDISGKPSTKTKSVTSDKCVSKSNTQTFQDEVVQSKRENLQDNSEKQTMSYTEFLGMFKSPTQTSEPEPVDTEDRDEIPVSDTEPVPKKPVQCKSIMSYFSKTEKKIDMDNSSSNSTSTSVTVTAEIHTTTLSTTARATIADPKKTGKAKKVEKISPSKSHDEDDGIILLSSETIDESEDNEKERLLASKKRKSDAEVQKGSKKQRVAGDFVGNEVKAGIDCESNKGTNEQLPETKIVDTSLSESGCSSSQIKTPVLTTKKSQSTLSFGQSGLSLTRAKVADTVVNEEALQADVKDSKKAAGKRSTRKTDADSKIEDVTKQNDDEMMVPKVVEVVKETRKSRRQNADGQVTSKGVAAAAHQELSTNTTVVPEADDDDVVEVAAETPLRRRSARLIKSSQHKEEEVMDVDGDSEEENDMKSKKRKQEEKSLSKKSSSKDSSCESKVKKPEGKLAPIFTMVKTKDEPVKNVQPPVDPEKERLRREFLMSGIPEELKRQIASAASSVVSLDYPPFPSISHVQQLTVAIEQQLEKVMLRLRPDIEMDKLDSVSCDNLQWESFNHAKLQPSMRSLKYFEDFSSHPKLTDAQIDLLLNEIQLTDKKFPWRNLYSHIVGKLQNTETSADEALATNTSTAKTYRAAHNEDDVVVVVDDTSPVSQRLEVKQVSYPEACLWSDLHQPENCEQIIGNTSVVKQLRSWLEEWKSLVQREVRKANKAGQRSTKGKKKDSSWSDDSDFTDSEEEEITLCNTVLITGPHGVGKTATVYALAQELGYKVFEVNSSSLRSGRQLLAQLEEATQSHRVAPHRSVSALSSGLDTPPAGSPKSDSQEKVVKPKSKAKQLTSTAQAFATLFGTPKPPAGANNQSQKLTTKGSENKKSSEVSGKTQSKRQGKTSGKEICSSSVADKKLTPLSVAKKDGGRKKQKMDESDANSKDSDENSTAKKGKMKKKSKTGVEKPSAVTAETESDVKQTSGAVNLASVSLILFDEVDVVFEEDKGFLATVQHFMTSTKIPIILTSADASFQFQLSARHDHLMFRQPSLASAASFLRTVCLAHDVRVGRRSVMNILRYTKGDIRQCLLHLQLWCESGGGRLQVAKPVNMKPQAASMKYFVEDDAEEKMIKHSEDEAVVCDEDNDSENDFICLRPASKRQRRIIEDDDENSNSSASLLSEASNSKTPSSTPSQAVDVTMSQSKPVASSRSSKRKAEDSVEASSRNEEGSDKVTKNVEKYASISPPVLHVGCEETLLGIQHHQISGKSVVDIIRAQMLPDPALNDILHSCRVTGHALNQDLIYQFALHALPLPKTDLPVTQLTIPAPVDPLLQQTLSDKKPRKRIIQGDWLDSDASDDDTPSASSKQEDNLTENFTKTPQAQTDKETTTVSSDVQTESGKTSEQSKANDNINTGEAQGSSQIEDVRSKPSNAKNHHSTAVLSELARYYEFTSFTDIMDMHLSTTSGQKSESSLYPGMSDDEEKHAKLPQHNFYEDSWQLHGFAQLLSARKMHRTVEKLNKDMESPGRAGDEVNMDTDKSSSVDSYLCDGDKQEALCLPVGKCLPDIWSKVETCASYSNPALKDVTSCLGPVVEGLDSALHTDYLPYLRDICRSEDARHQAKTQRRFHHYLEHIGLGLKSSTKVSLTSTFTFTEKPAI